MPIALALIPAAIGLALLRRTWARHARYPRLTTLAAWALIAISLPAAALGMGAEQGITVALGAISLLAWLLVAAAPDRRPGRQTPPVRSAQSMPSAIEGLNHAVLLVLVVPLSALLAALASLMVAHLLFDALNNEIAFAIGLFPIVWGALASAAFIIESRAAFIAVLAAVAVISAGGLML